MCKFLKWTSFWLIFIGAVNWGLIALFGFDLVEFLFGSMTLWTRIVYGLVALSAFVYLSTLYLCEKNMDNY